jgi:sec-independent protein translocase protein TatA
LNAVFGTFFCTLHCFGASMFDIGGGELLFILLAIVLLFGPKKLPELARSFGKGMAQLRKAQSDFQRNLNSLEEEIDTTVRSTFDAPQAANSASRTGYEVGAEPLTEQTSSDTHGIEGGIEGGIAHGSESAPAPQQLTPIRIQPAEGSIAQSAPSAPESASSKG